MIGLSSERKKETAHPIPYLKKSKKEKEQMLLSWACAESDVLEGVLMSSELIEKSSFSEDIPLMNVDENVNIKRIQKFFKKTAWADLMK